MGGSKMKIEITQQEIDNGRGKVYNGCAIELAVRNRNPEISDVVVGSARTTLCCFGSAVRYSNSVMTRKFILDFDKGEKVFPQTVELFPLERIQL